MKHILLAIVLAGVIGAGAFGTLDKRLAKIARDDWPVYRAAQEAGIQAIPHAECQVAFKGGFLGALKLNKYKAGDSEHEIFYRERIRQNIISSIDPDRADEVQAYLDGIPVKPEPVEGE